MTTDHSDEDAADSGGSDDDDENMQSVLDGSVGNDSYEDEFSIEKMTTLQKNTMLYGETIANQMAKDEKKEELLTRHTNNYKQHVANMARVLSKWGNGLVNQLAFVTSALLVAHIANVEGGRISTITSTNMHVVAYSVQFGPTFRMCFDKAFDVVLSHLQKKHIDVCEDFQLLHVSTVIPSLLCCPTHYACCYA